MRALRFVTLRRAMRGAGYVWAAPNSALGLSAGLVMVMLGARVQIVAGTVEFTGGWLGHLVAGSTSFGAMTLGHVILATSDSELAVLRAHEQAHVRQYEQWGPFFLPAYALSSGWQILRGLEPHRDNFFERQARVMAQGVTTTLFQPRPETIARTKST